MEPSTYCDAEMLHWSYDATSQALLLWDNRVLLNCCGDHSMVVTHDATAALYTITEEDAPEGPNGVLGPTRPQPGPGLHHRRHHRCHALVHATRSTVEHP